MSERKLSTGQERRRDSTYNLQLLCEWNGGGLYIADMTAVIVEEFILVAID